MSLIINADGEYLSGTGGSFAPAGATQVTMAICVKRDSGTSTYQSYCAVAGDLTITYGSIGLAHNGASVDCFIYPSGSEYRIDPSVNSSSTAWQWLIFTYEKDVASKVYTALVGGSVNSGTDDGVPAFTFNNTLDEIRIGLGNLTQAGWFSRARLAHCAVWNTRLTSTEIADLVSGGAGGISKNPQAIQNANLTFYAPLTSDATVTVGGLSLSATGTLTYDGADNPNVEAYGGGSVDGAASGATLTGTSSLTAGGASGTASGTATGANLTGTSSISAGAATGNATGSFTTAAMENNSGAGLLASTSVAWTWYEGAIGSAPTSTTHGTGTTNGSGILTVTGLPVAAGFLLARTTDSSGVYYQSGTPA